MTEASGQQGLVIDQLAQAAEQAPQAPLLPDRAGESWQRLTNARAWAQSGAVASWLIAQGYGPEGRVFAVPKEDTPGHAVVLLGALRAGALVVEGPCPVEVAVLVHCSIDAAVAERRRHIDADTPARRCGAKLQRHGDFKGIADAVASASRP
jgi:acyl-CoA synthetase (AMP-forming)/AMP-acid ligase II